MDHNSALISIIAATAIGSFCLAASEKTKIPEILYYFIFGIAFGKYSLGIINTDSLCGGLTIIVSLFVVIILFEGGLSLNVTRLKQINKPLSRQILFTLAVMFPIGFIAAHYIMDLSHELSLMFASLTIVTGPTVIKPIIRYIPLSNRVTTFLNGEAVIIDAIGAVLSIVVLDYVLSTQVVQNTILRFLYTIAIGAVNGALFGLLTKFLITRTKTIHPSIKSIFMLGIIFLNFMTAELVAAESGLMSVAILGIIMSTIDYKNKESLLSFKEQMTRIIIAILFILLAANFNFKLLSAMLLPGFMVVFILILVRFPIVFTSTAGANFNFRERLFMGWIGPRGIIALSLVSIAGIKLKAAGFSDSDKIELLVFMLIAVTVFIQSISARHIARRLKITIHGDRNIILLSVNNVSLTVADRWRRHGHDAVFIDTLKSNCAIAEKEGYKCVLGNGLNSQTFANFDVDHYNSAFAASTNYELNVLFCRFIKDTYGISNLYCLQSVDSSEELNEIIADVKIKTLNLISLIKKKRDIIDSIFSFFRNARLFSHSIRLANGDMIDMYKKNIPSINDYFLLCVVRGDDCYINSPEIKLEIKDELIFISHLKEKKALLDVFEKQPLSSN